jgi:adenosylcobalamin-dependent ribonucleoside-triphosphate reductase
MSMDGASVRAYAIYRRSYSRPLNEEETVFETWEETVDRVIEHQLWLWERAKGAVLDEEEMEELEELREIMYRREATVSGRTLWLGGTQVSKDREASQFNCSAGSLRSVSDMVDAIWLLLQGCGVGGKMEPGLLSGFAAPIPNVTVIPSDAAGPTGEDANTEWVDSGVWTIRIGDSAEAWAKAFGKLLAGKHKVQELVLDFRPIRPGGFRLKGYGWISSGDTQLRRAMSAIVEILNGAYDRLLTKAEIHDIFNWMGTVLSSRRSAEIALCDFDSDGWEEFATFKKDYWVDNVQRGQSNNSLLFWHKPSKLELRGLFQMMIAAGGSEPGFINAEAARKRAPYFYAGNPCFEILLPDGGFCNLVETNLSAFNGRPRALEHALYLIARANYRQTCVNLRDGMLQDKWHESQEFLRLCGAGLTGIVGWEHAKNSRSRKRLQEIATNGANSMADELDMTRPKLVTTIKPSGTLSKVMDTTEGIHAPLGRYIFNNVTFGKADPLVPKLKDAGYRVREKPGEPESYLVTLPFDWGALPVFTKQTVVRKGHDGSEAEVEVEVNLESAIDQLNRYKDWMQDYVQHNCSVTISYDPTEVDEIVEWLDENWDSYVGVSWLFRNDPTKSPQDLGFEYLPQEVVTAADFSAYVSKLERVDFGTEGSMETPLDDECAGGVCPVR